MSVCIYACNTIKEEVMNLRGNAETWEELEWGEKGWIDLDTGLMKLSRITLTETSI